MRDEVLATALAFAGDLGKIAVPSGVCDGFIGNRIMSAYRREADYMLEDGALPQEVDAAMTGFGFPMGVFAMQDLAGLDIAWAMRKRRAATRPASERYVAIADRLCEMGRLGRKTGAGWYDYPDGGAGQPSPVTERIILEESARRGIARRALHGRGDHGAHPAGDAGGGPRHPRRGHRRLARRDRRGDGQRLRLPALARRADADARLKRLPGPKSAGSFGWFRVGAQNAVRYDPLAVYPESPRL